MSARTSERCDLSGLQRDEWAAVQAVWRQKPILAGLQKGEEGGVKDSLRGLKLICQWVCEVIEMHFKSQALQFVEKKITKVRVQSSF